MLTAPQNNQERAVSLAVSLDIANQGLLAGHPRNPRHLELDDLGTGSQLQSATQTTVLFRAQTDLSFPGQWSL